MKLKLVILIYASNLCIQDESDVNADTTNLDQVYSEKILSVSIKYPKGWAFIDKNKWKKLDGVTFWANDGLYNPLRYIKS